MSVQNDGFLSLLFSMHIPDKEFIISEFLKNGTKLCILFGSCINFQNKELVLYKRVYESILFWKCNFIEYSQSFHGFIFRHSSVDMTWGGLDKLFNFIWHKVSYFIIYICYLNPRVTCFVRNHGFIYVKWCVTNTSSL